MGGSRCLPSDLESNHPAASVARLEGAWGRVACRLIPKATLCFPCCASGRGPGQGPNVSEVPTRAWSKIDHEPRRIDRATARIRRDWAGQDWHKTCPPLRYGHVL